MKYNPNCPVCTDRQKKDSSRLKKAHATMKKNGQYKKMALTRWSK